MIYVPHVRVGPSWMDPIIQFLSKDVLPEDKSEAEKKRRKASWFWLSEDQKLYNDLSRGHIYYAYILKYQSYFLRNCMRESMEAI